MLAALIKLNPKEILKVYNSKPINVNVPNTWQSYDVEVGYKTPDGNYQVVDVVPFIVPAGKRIKENPLYPTYTFQNETVVETYDVEDIPHAPEPTPSKIIDAPIFIARFTDTEYSNIKKAALAQIEQGGAQLQKWIDIATAEGFIDLDRPATQDAKLALVALKLLTQERADIIFSISGE